MSGAIEPPPAREHPNLPATPWRGQFVDLALRAFHSSLGDPAGLASRLEGVAEPGPIVLSQTAAEHLEDEIELEDLGERALKNVARPVRCWAIRA